MIVDRAALRNFNFALLGATLLVAALGVVNLFSAAQSSNPGLYKQQMVRIGAGLFIALVLSLIDGKTIERVAYPIYFVTVAMLVAVLAVGKTAKGSQRWLDVGPVHIQPSEMMKIGLVLALARWFSSHGDPERGHGLRELIVPMAIVLLPAALILPQPDLGSAGMAVLVGATILVFMKIRLWTLLLLVVGGAGTGVAGWLWGLEAYQRKRVVTFLDPEADTLGAGYHAYQSLVAVGSGQLTGKGWGNGTQTQLRFLPEQHTDFIFSVLSEEWGLAGGVVLLVSYLLLLALGLSAAAECKDRMGTIVGVGMVGVIFWHVVINIGMVIGLLPVVGVPLPLMSYGGSSALTTLVAVGLLLNVSMRKPTTSAWQ